MLGSEHLGYLFFLVVLSYSQAVTTSHDQPRIKFNVSLEHDTTPLLPGDLQRICLQCGWERNTTSKSNMRSSPLFSGNENQVSAQEIESKAGEWGGGQFYITVGGSEKSTLANNLTNYTSSLHENGNITATFYISRQTRFVGEFTCGYNSSSPSSNFTNIKTDLVFAYVPTNHETYFHDSTFLFLFGFFCFSFLLTLAFLIICCVCKSRRSRPSHLVSEEKAAESGTTKNDLLLVQKPSSLSESVKCTSVDDLLKILSHPSPCLSKNCPCSCYKRKLLNHLKQTAMRVQTPVLRSDLGMALNMNLQGNSLAISQLEVEVDQGYSSVASRQPPPVTRAVRQDQQAVETDLGYYSVSSQLPPLETENSTASPHLVADIKGYSTGEVEMLTDVETAKQSSQIVECPTSPAFPVDPPTTVSKFPERTFPPHFSDVLPCDCQDISYPKIYPDINDEVSGLSEEYDLNMRFINPTETIQLDSNGGRYANENHEVYVRFPRGFIPEGKTISVEVGVSLHSALVSLLPLESRPVSPLVKLCVVGEPNLRFLKPVEVTLPHFLDITDEDDVDRMGLQFLKSGHSLYCFHESDGVATFKPRVGTATLKTSHFCTFCITAKQNISNKKINYRLVKVVPKNRKEEMWRVNFCVSYYLRTCLQALRKQFPNTEYEMKTLRRFKFGELGQLEIHFERKLAGGWQMALESSSKIRPEAVKCWELDPDELEMLEEDRIYPPRFEVQVCGSHAREPVTALICFRGMADIGGDTTELVLEPVVASLGAGAEEIKPPYHMLHGRFISTPVISLDQQVRPSTLCNPYDKEESGTLSRTGSGRSFYNGPAHSDLMNFVAATLPTKWRLVGVQLGLSITSLEEIEKGYSGDCKRCFSAVFSEWEHQNTSPYCWDTVVRVLQAPSVEENRVAEDVRTHFNDSCSLYSNRSSTASSSGYSTETHV